MSTFQVDPGSLHGWSDALDEAVSALDAGELVVFPTETVYGIACRPDLPEATDRLFAAKRRPASLNLPVLAATASEAWEVGRRSETAERLASHLWPGPLTLVLRRTDRSRSWALGELVNSVGVRVPRHAIAAALLERTGPLAVTSANVSGEPPLSSLDAIEATFGRTAATILVLPEGAPPPGGTSSTVLDMTWPFPTMIREGAITRMELVPYLPRFIEVDIKPATGPSTEL